MTEIKGTVKEVPGGIEWRIDDFLSLTRLSYVSPEFSFAATSWHLGIIIYRAIDIRCQIIDLFLQRTTPCPSIHLEFSFSVKTQDEKKTLKTKFFDTDPDGHYFSSTPLCLNNLTEYVPNGRLTGVCTFKQRYVDAEAEETSTVEEKNTCATQSEVLEARGPYNSKETDYSKTKISGEDCTRRSSCHHRNTKVLLDLKELFLKKENCDVVLKVKGTEFPAHKAILTARSPVFGSTFRCDMKEKATGIVDIEDCDPASFSDFLCYLYCGAVEKLSEQNVLSLFAAADKFDVQDLRAECLQFMKENLSDETFCDTLTLALRHSETELIKRATDFFIRNAPKIILTVKWQKFLVDNPTQSNELLIKLLVPDKNSNL